MKRRFKIIVDVLMFVLFLYLLSYRPGMGLMYHAVVGILQLALFILHHILNLPWYKALFRGHYSFYRVVLTVSDFLLLIAFGFMVASSVMVSGMVFDFVGIRMTSIWRRIHVGTSGWCFLLIAFHVGMHMRGMYARLKRKMAKVVWLYHGIETILLGTGIYCFTVSDLWPKITMARRLPLVTYSGMELFGIYLAIVIGMSILTNWIFKAETLLQKRKR